MCGDTVVGERARVVIQWNTTIIIPFAHLHSRGFIPPVKKGEKEPNAKTKLTGDAYQRALKESMVAMWNKIDVEGKAKFEYEIYNGVEYHPFNPTDMSIVDYKGRFTSKNRKLWEGANHRGFYYQSKWEKRTK